MSELDLTEAIEAGVDAALAEYHVRLAAVTTTTGPVNTTAYAKAAVRAAAPIIERAARAEREVASKEVMHALLGALREFRDAIAPPPAPDHEVQSWPLCTPEQEFGGGVWCADEDCPLQAARSEIGDFREGTFTLAELHRAVGEHIAARREREEAK